MLKVSLLKLKFIKSFLYILIPFVILHEAKGNILLNLSNLYELLLLNLLEISTEYLLEGGRGGMHQSQKSLGSSLKNDLVTGGDCTQNPKIENAK